MQRWTHSSRGPYTELPSEVELGSLATPAVEIPAQTPKLSWRQRHSHGWRFGVLWGATLACTVLLINFIVTIVATTSKGSGTGTRRIIFQGDCEKAEKLDLVAHFLINAMSTVLLSASNYAMQCLTAPTRDEVDAAHAKRKWLDIGILSVRNLRNVQRKRAILWGLLGASSLPLHLL